jgi:hypothetical protein
MVFTFTRRIQGFLLDIIVVFCPVVMDCIFFALKTCILPIKIEFCFEGKTEFNLIITYLVGVVKDKRTIWRLSIISDFFQAVVNFIRMFFLTMFSVSGQN